jgi:glycosyltransferase involved in cell wall biosynthesis
VTILYFADIRFPLERANGIQTMETCRALADSGHDVTLIVRPDTHDPPRDPFEYYAVQPSTRLRIERAQAAGPAPARRLGYLSFALGRAAGRGRADLLFTRDLGVAAALLLLPPRVRAPLVYESHGYAPDVAGELPNLVSTARAPGNLKLARLRRRERRVWRRADGYVTITKALADELRQRFGPRDRLAVVPDGTRLPAGDEAGASPVVHSFTGFVIGYAGHLYPWKGVDVLLDAIAQIPEAQGLIVGGHEGEPDFARLKARAGRLGIANRVAFSGLVAPSRVHELLAAADVLVLPNPATTISTRFTSPLKLFEYMAARRPVVASDLPAIREVLRDGETALLVRPGDPDALAAAIRRLKDDPALARRLAAAARDAVDEFTWSRRAQRLDALFEQVLQHTRGSGPGARGAGLGTRGSGSACGPSDPSTLLRVALSLSKGEAAERSPATAERARGGRAPRA